MTEDCMSGRPVTERTRHHAGEEEPDKDAACTVTEPDPVPEAAEWADVGKFCENREIGIETEEIPRREPGFVGNSQSSMTSASPTWEKPTY